jgi:hypothetical protein
MKKVVLLLSVCLLLGLKGYSQFSFGVSPGLSTNTAYFGFKIGKVVPYVGLQYASAHLNVEVGDTIDGKVSLIVPEVGVKFFAIEKNKLKAYFNLNVTKPFISGKLTQNGTEMDSFGETLKDVKLIGGNFGFGVEYFFDDNFSVGGEYGVQYLHGKYDEDFGIKVGVVPTYSKISLNFYFGDKKSE